jgi:hypothetical protein
MLVTLGISLCLTEDQKVTGSQDDRGKEYGRNNEQDLTNTKFLSEPAESLSALSRFVRFSFAFQAREKLRGQHVRGALDHPLAYTGQQSPNIDLSCVLH